MGRPAKPRTHGTIYNYHKGCRCALCKTAAAGVSARTRALHPGTRSAWRRSNKTRINAQTRAYKAKAPRSYREALWAKAGIDMTQWSWAQFEQMLTTQQFKCACCGTPICATRSRCSPGVQVAHTDHNHVTGKVRGLLCRPCNLAAGYLRDNPELADQLAIYLRGIRA